MFYAIFQHELKYWLKNSTTYIYLTFFLILSALTMAGFAGMFGEGSVDGSSVANSPWNLYSLFKLYGKLLLFLIPTIVGHALYRDYKSNMHAVLYSYPFEKSHYLLAKFSSAFVIVMLISLALGTGFSIGTTLPGVNPELVLPFDLTTYLQLYGVYLIPNMLLVGVIVFAIVAFSRKIYAGFISVLVFMVLREIISRAVAGVDSTTLTVLLEPFGEFATAFYIGDWTANEKNNLAIPFGNLIVWNRMIWLGFTLTLFAVIHKVFSFHQQPLKFSLRKARDERRVSILGRVIGMRLSSVRFDYSFLHQIKTVWRLAVIDFKYIISRGYFISITLVGIIFVTMLIAQMNPQYDTRIIPVTWMMLAFPVFFISMLIDIMTFLFAGVLVHRSKTHRIDMLIDVTPFPDWVFIGSKVLALVKMQVLLLSGTMAAGILIQAFNGYYDFEIELYLFSLFGIHLIGFIIWALAAVFVHSLFTNMYLGIFVLIVAYFGIPQLSQLGITSPVLQFNQNPEPGFFLNYSDLSGYGHALIPYFLYKLYWLMFGIVLFFGARVFWIRGLPESFKERLTIARARFKSVLALGLLSATVAFFAMGVWLNAEENRANPNLTVKTQNQLSREADDKYKKYAHFIQPRIVAVNVNIDLFPDSESFHSEGTYVLVNKSTVPIDTLLIHKSRQALTDYELNRAHRSVVSDTVVNLDILRMNKAIEPGDSLVLSFDVQNISNTLLKKNSPVVENGTFLTSSIYPEIGYYVDRSDTPPTDTTALQNHYRAIDADFVDLEMIVSTSDEQTVVASGFLEKEWTEQNRNYFKFVSHGKATRDFALCSARYEVAREQWQNVDLEVYYHKGHDYNLASMFQGLKATLEYHENNFGSFSHPTMKIAEFPRALGNHAQSFAGLIVWSEIGFIVERQTQAALDFPFLGAAHEMAHQWWGHQVIPADVMGARMITESMSEYVSLKVLEREYGLAAKRKFLKMASDLYLEKRKNDTEPERPLMYNEGLSKKYVPYHKGVLVMNAMNEYLGESVFTRALNNYYQRVKLQEAPYTTAVEMVEVIREATPDSLQYLIRDLFETVTFYDNVMFDTNMTHLPNGEYEVELKFDVRKYRENSEEFKHSENSQSRFVTTSDKAYSERESIPLADYVEIAVYSKDSKIYHRRHKVISIENTLKLRFTEKPTRCVVDPNLLLLDKNREDNQQEIM